MIGKDTASNDTITDDEVLIMDAVINGPILGVPVSFFSVGVWVRLLACTYY